MLSVHLPLLPVLNPYAGLNYVWQGWGKVGLAKISGSHKCPESWGWKEESLVVPSQQGHPQQLPAAFFCMPICICKSSTRGPCSIQCLAPNWEACKDAEDMGEGKGDMQGSALGCVQRKLGILWENPSGAQGKGARLLLWAARTKHSCP